MENIIGIRELREHTKKYSDKVKRGESFTVVKHTRPLFKIVPVENEDMWEKVADFTTIQKGGVDIHDILSRL
jgi:prevent-host-death family protein